MSQIENEEVLEKTEVQVVDDEAEGKEALVSKAADHRAATTGAEPSQPRRYPFTNRAFRLMADPDEFGQLFKEHFLILKTFQNLEELRDAPTDEVDLAHFFGRDGKPEICEICGGEFQPYWGGITIVDFERELTDSLHNHSDHLTDDQVDELYLYNESDSVFGNRRKMVGSRVVLVVDGNIICDGWGCGTPWFNRRQPLKLRDGRLIYASPNADNCLGELRLRAGRLSAQLKTLRQLRWMADRFSEISQVSELVGLYEQVEKLVRDKKAPKGDWQDVIRYTAKKILAERDPNGEGNISFFYEKVEDLLLLVNVRLQQCCSREYGDLLVATLAPDTREAREIAKSRRQKGADAAEERMVTAAFSGGYEQKSRPKPGLRGGL